MASQGVTQKELAEVLGCHQPQIARMLKDEHSPTIANVLKVCSHLKISLGAAFSS
jgi:transcriptional regulator with XRE-family HTH domain